MFDKSRGGDETRHKYLTHSEWHTDSKFVGLLKVGYQTSLLEQLQLQKVGSMEYLRKRLRGLSKRFLGFVPPKRLVCCVQRHHAIDKKQMEVAIRDMLMMTEVPAALRRHMYDQIRIVETKRRTVVNGLAEQVKFAATSTRDTEPECKCSTLGDEYR